MNEIVLPQNRTYHFFSLCIRKAKREQECEEYDIGNQYITLMIPLRKVLSLSSLKITSKPLLTIE